MNIKQPKSITPSPIFFSDDLIAEVLSFLPVKSLIRFKSVNKSWKTLISDPKFVKSHLNKSQTLNPQFTLILDLIPLSIIPYSISRLIDNPTFTISEDPYYSLDDKECSEIVGCCNGLICLANYSLADDYEEYWLRLWNPATRTISSEFGYFRDYSRLTWPNRSSRFQSDGIFIFKFGCDNDNDNDNSTGTYKVVASRYNGYEFKCNVKILSFGDNVWRDIESFPVKPLNLEFAESSSFSDEGVYLSGTLNWFAIRNHEGLYICKELTIEQFVIVSLDLGTETYNQYKLPREFDEVPPGEPAISVLGGCLCFSYCFKETDFVMWRMMEFGVEESWTQFLKISFQNLQLGYDFSDKELKYNLRFVPLFLSEDVDTLILRSSEESCAILYNWRDNIVRRTGINQTRDISNRLRERICWDFAREYVESLVSI